MMGRIASGLVAGIILALTTTAWAITSDVVYGRVSPESRQIVDTIKEKEGSKKEICKGREFVRDLVDRTNSALIGEDRIAGNPKNKKGALKFFKVYCREN